MTFDWSIPGADEKAVRRIAEGVALKIRAGDAIALYGDLGAGKTAFARALIRALLGDPAAEVPSPTFPILQTYETPRLTVSHLDLYRIGGESEASELGVDELVQGGAIVVEWPERAPGLIGPDRLELRISEASQPDQRMLRLIGHGTWEPRLERIKEIFQFLDGSAAWRGVSLAYLQGDASARAYARIATPERHAILMDWPRQPDGPPIRDGLPYSRIAHLAEGVPAFCDVASLLLGNGYSAPRILAEDRDRGLLVIEDLGDQVFGREVAAGKSMREMWAAAVDTLVDLREFIGIKEIDTGNGPPYVLPAYDRRAMGIETELVPDWYWPLVKSGSIPPAEGAEFLSLWAPLFDLINDTPAGLVLRDYHSPNLLWLPAKPAGKAHVGIIDFQDAVLGHPAYDLVSLFQDARLDVPADLEAELFERYVNAVERREPGFDRKAFSAAYAALGAQRNTKILGIFARLAKRDGKPVYLQHIPRIWRYLERDLAHPQLATLRGWYDRNFPAPMRARVLDA